MAGDWIKIEKATARKPEIIAISEQMGVHVDHAFGLFVRYISWCDDQISNCHAQNVTKTGLNAALSVTGFAESLENVGWVSFESGHLVIANFEKHLSKGAKTRATTTIRKQSERSRKCHAPTVTKTGPEKRREEKNIREREEEASPALAHVVPTGRRITDHTAICSRINAMRPEWGRPAQWTGAELHALHDALGQLEEFTDEDWGGLKRYFSAKLEKGAGYWQPKSRGQFVANIADVFGNYARWSQKESRWKTARPANPTPPPPKIDQTDEDRAALAEFLKSPKPPKK